MDHRTIAMAESLMLVATSVHVVVEQIVVLTLFHNFQEHLNIESREDEAKVLLPATGEPICQQTNAEYFVDISKVQLVFFDGEKLRVLQCQEGDVSEVMEMFKVAIG